MWLAAVLTAVVTFGVLLLERLGFRPLEVVITLLVGVIALCYVIVLCRHGRSRLRDRIVGNLGQQLAARQHTPVLLVPARNGHPPPSAVRHCLAPLDGEPCHQRGLSVAAELAKLMRADLLLATVVNPRHAARKHLAATPLPGTMRRIAEFHQASAVEFLRQQTQTLAGRGVQAAAVVIAGGEPARQLARLARQRHADLIALTTHGRAGTRALWARSLPPRLLRRSHAMFLLVPVEERRGNAEIRERGEGRR